MQPVLDGARAIEVLAQAAAVKDNPRRQRELAASFHCVLEASPTFRAFTSQGVTEFPHLVDWIAIGWKKQHY